MAEKTTETVKKVRIKLPISTHEKGDKVVGVNGEIFTIQRGKYVEVPDYVAEALENSEREDFKSFEKIEQLRKR